MEHQKIYPISKVDPNDTKIELNCRAVKALLLYFEEKYGRKELEEFIFETNMNLDYLENKNNWVSYDYWCRLLDRLIEYTKDPMAPFFAGTYVAKKECYGTLEGFFTRLGTPRSVYKLTVEFLSFYSKLGKTKISKLKRNSCVISVDYFNGFKQNKNNCLNVQGAYSAIPTFWGLPLAKVDHTQCAVNSGTNTCIYKFYWQNRFYFLFGLSGILAGILAITMLKGLFGFRLPLVAQILLPVNCFFAGIIIDYRRLLTDTNKINEKTNQDLMQSIQTIEELNKDLQNKVECRTEELAVSNRQLQNVIDELNKSQDQLIKSEKMASIGRLAAGMAHELNNPIGAIRNYIQDMLEDTDDSDFRWSHLKMAEKATSRCKRIINDLLTFSRETPYLKLQNINELIQGLVLNIHEDMPNPNIKIFTELTDPLPEIKIDKMQIQQVFWNLIMNAADAIKGTGEIWIKTYMANEVIYIEVSDTGAGIPENIQDKIFDPFFSTKSPGKGMGLGLSISYNIVQQYNGKIDVISKKDKGTTFTISLPVNDK